MNYITDYQLDINKGFQCKVNGKRFDIMFNPSNDGEHWFLPRQFEKLLIELKLDPDLVVKPYGTLERNYLVYCDSKQKCYDLCQHIVATYFKPAELVKDIISFKCGDKSYKFELKLLFGEYVWENTTDKLKYIINKSQVNLTKLREELNIKIYDIANSGYLGFDNKAVALKFAKYIKETFYYKHEVCEKSKRFLAKYYNDDQSAVTINGKQWNLIWNHLRNVWWYHHRELGVSKYWECFGFNPKSVIDLCSYLGISAKYTNKLEFDSRQDAIKFTDYLIETYIIKKEKTYDTNQLRKKRATLSRGFEPAGSIIHGRRSKASVRCRHLEHKARIGC